MPQYAFILGRNPALSRAEIQAVVAEARTVAYADDFLILETNEELDGLVLIGQLGGTIKIGKVLASVDKKIIVDSLQEIKSTGKLKFGLSYYDCPPDNLGLEVKKLLKEAGIASRLVTSRDKALSSVVVAKNKCHEFLILKNKWLAQTAAVQDFEKYSQRDYGRPARDTKSGTLPPKLAKIMINLAQRKLTDTILDPFCGSGTILQEALLLGYKKIIGTDISPKAIGETEKNLAWLSQQYGLSLDGVEVFQTEVSTLSRRVSSVAAIVTEPYLGPGLHGNESSQVIETIARELEELYRQAFSQFAQILSAHGRVVIVFPWFKKFDRRLNIIPAVQKLGFEPLSRDELVYSRPEQKVWRQIFVFVKR